MKLTILVGAAALLVTEAVAQDCLNVALTAIPSCAQSCFLDGAPAVGCGGTDFACQCNQEAALYAAIEGCVASGCSQPSYQAVIDGASSVCNCATAAFGIADTPGSSMGSYVTTGSFLPTGSATSAIPITTGATSTSSTAAPTSGAAAKFHCPQSMVGLVGGAVAAAMLIQGDLVV